MAISQVLLSNSFMKFTNAPRSNRMTARLSTGHILVLTAQATSATSSTLALMIAVSETAPFTVAASWSMGNVAFGQVNAAMTVDEANNVHVVYQNWTNSAKPAISYVKLTYGSGPAFTVGTPTTIRAANTVDRATAIDIDYGGTGANGRAVIAVRDIAGTTTTWRYYMMTNATTAAEITGLRTSRTGYSNVNNSITGVTCRHTNEGDGSIVVSYIAWSVNAYYVGVAKVTTAGVATPISAALVKVGLGQQLNCRAYQSGDREATWFFWDAASVSYVRIGWNVNVDTFTKAAGTPFKTPKGVAGQALDRNDVAMVDPRKFLLLTFDGNTVAYDTLIDLNLNRAVRYYYQKKPAGWTRTNTGVFAGFNRGVDLANYNPLIVAFARNTQTTNNLVALYLRQNTPGVPTGITPGNNSTINTDVPRLAVTIPVDAQGNQSSYTVQWQFASDASFATNVKNEYSDLFGAPYNVVDKLTATSRLFQGAWFLRARIVNEWGLTSGWSSPAFITDTHYGIATNSSPSNGTVVPYASGTVQFNWTYTDTSEVAKQSAYQIVVVDPAGAVVFDTGKVVSQLTAVGLVLPSSAQDMRLDYTIDVWDDQDVQSVVNSELGRYFFMSTNPSPLITSPTPNSTPTTGAIAISWDPGLANGKTQASWRMTVTDSQSKKVIWDSGLRATQETQTTPPRGTFRNLKSYIVSLYVTDSIGLSNVAFANYAFSFTPPAPPSPVYIFADNYSLRNRVWIGWTSANIESFFISWNVYRRERGTTVWNLLQRYTNPDQPFFGYSDTTACSGVTYQYLVTQVTNPNGLGDIVESSFDNYYEVRPQGSRYWLVDTDDNYNPVPLYNVTSDSYTDETERTVYTVPGRGRKVEVGERLGVSGSLEVQLRDRGLSYGTLITNYLADPSMRDTLPYSQWWTLSSSGDASFEAVRYIEESPADHDQSLMVSLSQNAVAYIGQRLPSIPYLANTDKIAVSVWVGDVKKLWNFGLTAKVEAFDASNNSLGSQTVTLVQGENFQNHGNWYRYSNTLTGLPAGPARVEVTYNLTDSANTAPQVVLTGFQVNSGNLAPYLDGELRGCYWTAEPFRSASATTGFYTARKQRQDIKDLIIKTDDLRLMTPFGDSFNIATADTGLSRLAGTGSQSEHGGFTLPYMEVAD